MYYIYLNNKSEGPFSLKQIETMVGDGSITTETLYYSESDQGWKRVAELSAGTPVKPPPPPPNLTAPDRSLDNRRPCPFCGEQILKTAVRCPHCAGEMMYCPKCNEVVVPSLEEHRFSGWSWDTALMAFCPKCSTQIAGPEKSACFIAEAAYGSALAPELFVLRRFRDRTLKSMAIGKLFIFGYYLISPPIAIMIRKHDLLRHVTRCLLRNVVDYLKRPASREL